jgi:hypothetical protein
MVLANGVRGLIIGASMAGYRGRVIGKLDHDITVARASFHRLNTPPRSMKRAPNFSNAGRAAAS